MCFGKAPAIALRVLQNTLVIEKQPQLLPLKVVPQEADLFTT